MFNEVGPDMNQENIKAERNLIAGLAWSDPSKASYLLVNFAQRYAIDSNLVTDCILVQNEVNTALQENPREREAIGAFAEEILQLSIKIERDNRFNPDKERIESGNSILLKKYGSIQQPGEPVVSMDNIVFSYSNRGKTNFQLSNISLDLNFGEITGVVGENGNGKTTLLQIIAGTLKHKGGRLTYPALFRDNPFGYQKLKQQIAYIPQRLPEWNGTVKENLHFMASIKGIRGKENIREVAFIITRLGLQEFQNSRWDELSAGYQMRFELANMLVWKPRLLILDEPLANLDIKSQAGFLRSLRDLTTQIRHPMAVMISSQHLLMIEKVADHILFLKEGKAAFNGPATRIGADRKENMYEIECAISIHELRNALKDLTPVKVTGDGFVFHVRTGMHITSSILGAELIKAGVEVRLLRDISTSVKSFFAVE